MVFVSDIHPNPTSESSDTGMTGRSQRKCFQRDSVRPEDRLSKALTFQCFGGRGVAQSLLHNSV